MPDSSGGLIYVMPDDLTLLMTMAVDMVGLLCYFISEDGGSRCQRPIFGVRQGVDTRGRSIRDWVGLCEDHYELGHGSGVVVVTVAGPRQAAFEIERAERMAQLAIQRRLRSMPATYSNLPTAVAR